jgi:hypothetical protein
LARLFDVDGDLLSHAGIAMPAPYSFTCYLRNPSGFKSIIQMDSGGLLGIGMWNSNELVVSRQFTGNRPYWITNTFADDTTAWTHVAVTQADSAAADPTFYVNGSPVSVASENDGPPSGSMTTTSVSVRVGSNHTPTAFVGELDWIALHDVVLTSGEVTEAMTYGYAERGIVGLWELDASSPVTDLSGNGNHLTVGGTPSVVSGPTVSSRTAAPTLFVNASPLRW